MLLRKSLFIEEVTQQKKVDARILNIIFLDIDGVVYCGSLHDEVHQARMRTEIDNIKSHPEIATTVSATMLATLDNHDLSAVLGFSKKAIENLRQLCVTCNAKIVISSSWRKSKSLEQLKALFSIVGFADFIIDVTPEFEHPSSRGDEVESWLLIHSHQIKSFVILDDYEFNIPALFGERFVLCNNLFADDILLQKASAILGKPLNYENSEAVLFWEALANNSPKLTKIDFNSEKITKLKVFFGWSGEVFFKELFSVLEKNIYVTHLTLNAVVIRCEIASAKFLAQVTALLQMGAMKLEYLNVAGNDICDVGVLLSAIDGIKLHIPHICLNANPLTNQDALAAWIESYHAPIKLDLNLSGAGGTYRLSDKVIKAININKNISVTTREDCLPTDMMHQTIEVLVSNGRLKVEKEPAKQCVIQ